jgi:enamine deaminase RidA (YjgF/YER057c/UK114 family)
MNMQRSGWCALVLSIAGAAGAWAADVERTAYPSGQKSQSARTVSVGNLIFPSGIAGTKGDPLAQVDEVVQQLHDTLAQRGLGIGSMLQHTIYLKDGAAPPIQVLTRFHAAATKLSPGLKDHPSVGTIVRVPEFPNKNTIVAIDAVAGAPAVKGKPDDFKRIPFTFGPKEIVETIGVDKLVFSAGLEAMDFEHGTLEPTIDEQIEVIVKKLHDSLRKAGLDVGNMISHNLYVKRGTDPMHVIQKFHEVTHRYAPELKTQPSVGTLVVVDGMAADGFLLEMDAVAARPQQQGKPDSYARVLFENSMDISKSVTVGDLVFLSGMEAMDGNKPVPSDVLQQVEVSVKKIDTVLRQSGLTIGNMVKHKLYVKKGSDVEQVRRKFHEVAVRLAPELKSQPSAETLVIVEGLASNQLLFEANVIAARSK